jgi:hypothetical protein
LSRGWNTFDGDGPGLEVGSETIDFAIERLKKLDHFLSLLIGEC